VPGIERRDSDAGSLGSVQGRERNLNFETRPGQGAWERGLKVKDPNAQKSAVPAGADKWKLIEIRAVTTGEVHSFSPDI
jgi:hypothetical protein